jgi:perosamine synthetase
MFENLSLLGREKFLSTERIESYRLGLCPVAENLQKRLMQFKTNYWELERAEEQAEILRKTLKNFS